MDTSDEPARSFASEAEERSYWETHDSTESVDWSKAEHVRLPSLKPSSTSISLIEAWLAEKVDAPRT